VTEDEVQEAVSVISGMRAVQAKEEWLSPEDYNFDAGRGSAAVSPRSIG
jgi:hypothetical protein